MRLKQQERFFTILKILIALVAMALLIHTVRVEEIRRTLIRPVRPLFFFLASCLLVPNLFIQWYRWHFLLKLIEPALPAWESIRSFFGGQVMAFITPGRIGEFGRALFLTRVDRMQALGMVLVEKVYAFLPIAIGGVWAFIGMWITVFGITVYTLIPMILFGLLISFLLTYPFLRPEIFRGLLYQFSMVLPVREKIKVMIQCMDRLEKREAFFYFIWSALFYFVYMIQFILFILVFDTFRVIPVWNAAAATMLAKTLLPFSLGDLGIREGAALFFFGRLGVKEAAAFNGSLLLFVVNVLVPTMMGIFFLPGLRLQRKP